MAKKKKGKKGKKGKKQKDDGQITEVERELFGIQIADLTAKVERLKARCLELEASNTEFEENVKKMENDRGDVVTYLTKQNDQKQEEIEELEERIEGLMLARESDVTMYKERIKQNDHDFKIMHEQLTSEIKLLSGKLNSLEDFRLQRDELMKKFKTQEEQMSEQDDKHKQIIYEVEKKFIIGKDKLKKEMEGKLLQLSSNFADATEIRIAATTHHAIRENIAINNELDLMIATHKKLTEENSQMKSSDKELKLNLELVEEEKEILLKRNAVLLKLLNRLGREHKDMEIYLAEMLNQAQQVEDSQKRLDAMERDVKEAKMEARIENQKLQGALYEMTQLKFMEQEAKIRGDRLMVVIDTCVNAVQEVIRAPVGEDESDIDLLLRRETLLNRLLQLMDSSTIQYIQVPGTEVSKQESAYETGDLGLVPRSGSPSLTSSMSHGRMSEMSAKPQSLKSHSSSSKSKSSDSSLARRPKAPPPAKTSTASFMAKNQSMVAQSVVESVQPLKDKMGDELQIPGNKPPKVVAATAPLVEEIIVEAIGGSPKSDADSKKFEDDEDDVSAA